MANLLIREGRSAEIMLVEDNRGDAMLASRAFKNAQIENRVTIAQTAEKALHMLRLEGEYSDLPRPDIILLDLNLPMMSGKDLLAILKADEDLRNIPVIVLSSSAAEVDVAESYGLHASAYVVKPLSLERFAEVVSRIEQFFFMLAVLPGADAKTA